MGMFGLFKPNVEKMKKERDVKGLIKALKHKDRYIRSEAASALAEIGDARVVEPFINALKDESFPAKAIVAKNLIKIGDERAVDPLVQYLKGEDNIYNLREIASVFGQIGRKHDKFDSVYDELARRLDLPKERGPEEEVHYTGRDVEKAIEKLCTIAIPRTPIITESEVVSKFRELKEAWGDITLLKGTLEELSDALRPRLLKDRLASTFDGFRVHTIYFQKASQVEAFFQTTFRGYRVWRTDKALFASFVGE